MKKLPVFEYSEVFTAAQIGACAFEELKEDEAKGLSVLKDFRSKFETAITNFDRRWVALCADDVDELTEWANRMRSIRKHLDELDRQLAVAGSKLFNWDSAIFAMAYVNAQRVAIEQVLSFNEPVPTTAG